MALLEEYAEARREGDSASLRRVLALRAMVARGESQPQIAEALGVSESDVSQQVISAPDLKRLDPQTLLDAGAPILKAIAEQHGYSRLAVFGSLARRQARDDSNIDLVVQAPEGTSSFGFIRLKQLMEHVLDREIDLIDYGGLQPKLDDDIAHEAVLL